MTISRSLCLLLGCLALLPLSAGGITFETRALTGTDGPLGPALGAGTSFSFFDANVLNSAGQIAFRSDLAGTGVTSANNNGIWLGGPGTPLTLIVRTGQPAPGTAAGVNFSSLSDSPVLNSAGRFAFLGSLTGTGVTATNNQGMWLGGGGTALDLLAREGAQAPGTAAGVNFSSFIGTPVQNGTGLTAFLGILTGTGVTGANDRGLWTRPGGTGTALTLLAREGNQAPGTAAGVNFSNLSDALPVLNGAGQIAFRGELTGTGVTTSNDRGIWTGLTTGGGTGLALLARAGNPAPGTAPGVNFKSFDSNPLLNDAGQTAFQASLAGTGITTANDVGMWAGGGTAGLVLVARKGSPAPGTPAGVNFSAFGNVVLNGAGQYAFLGFLSGTGVNSTNSFGLWTGRVGSAPVLLARVGSQASGLPAGLLFRTLSVPVMNRTGQAAFLGSVSGPGVNSTNEFAIWATGSGGLPQLVVRTGALFDVNADPVIQDLRTLQAFSLQVDTGGEDGRPSSFNDLGQLSFYAAFTGGSRGMFVARVPAVPPTLESVVTFTGPRSGTIRVTSRTGFNYVLRRMPTLDAAGTIVSTTAGTGGQLTIPFSETNTSLTRLFFRVEEVTP